MKWQTTAQFDADWASLPREHRRIFIDRIPAFSRACDAFLEDPTTQWPRALRVSRMNSAPGVWEMTWSFAGPDGRATFSFVTVGGEVHVLWRRVGTHGIYTDP